MSTKQKAGLEAWSTKEIALKETTDIKSLLDANKGKYVAFASIDSTKKKLKALAKKFGDELSEIEKKEELQPADKKRVEEIEKEARQNRYALQNISKHNVSVLAQASRDEKQTAEEIINIMQPAEDKANAILEAEKTRIAEAAAKRKAEFDAKIETARAGLQKIVDETTEFSQIDDNIEAFRALQILEAENDFAEFLPHFTQMVIDIETVFEEKINQITTAHDLAESKKAENAATLKAERLEELFNFDFKYKGEKHLGEIDGDEYESILNEAKIIYAEKYLKANGFKYLNDQDRNAELVTEIEGVGTYAVTLEEIKNSNFEELELLLTRAHDAVNPISPEVSEVVNSIKVNGLDADQDNAPEPEPTPEQKPEPPKLVNYSGGAYRTPKPVSETQEAAKKLLIEFSDFQKKNHKPELDIFDILDFVNTK